MEKADYLKKFRRNSFILTPQGRINLHTEMVDWNNRKSIDSQLVMRIGSDKKPGYYYSADDNDWIPVESATVKAEIKNIEVDFEDYKQTCLDEGREIPTVMPEEMADKLARFEAQLDVINEEIDALRKAREKAPELPEEQSQIQPRSRWSTGSMLDGEILERGGFIVSKNAEGIPCIDDDRSEHNGMPHWRFVKEIIKPMEWENNLRQNMEAKAAVAEKRPKKRVPYPQAGIWRKDSDSIEYPGYHPKTLDKIKHSQKETV